MKKAKIMLTAITVLAIAGGALAFKAKKFNSKYCYTTHLIVQGETPGGFTCPFVTQGVQANAGAVSFYTTIDDPNACAANHPFCGAVAKEFVIN